MSLKLGLSLACLLNKLAANPCDTCEGVMFSSSFLGTTKFILMIQISYSCKEISIIIKSHHNFRINIAQIIERHIQT